MPVDHPDTVAALVNLIDAGELESVKPLFSTTKELLIFETECLTF